MEPARKVYSINYYIISFLNGKRRKSLMMSFIMFCYSVGPKRSPDVLPNRIVKQCFRNKTWTIDTAVTDWGATCSSFLFSTGKQSLTPDHTQTHTHTQLHTLFLWQSVAWMFPLKIKFLLSLLCLLGVCVASNATIAGNRAAPVQCSSIQYNITSGSFARMKAIGWGAMRWGVRTAFQIPGWHRQPTKHRMGCVVT